MDAEFVTLTPENLAQETLCCIVRTRTKHPGVEAKRAWLAERLPEGHVFCKLRGNGCAFVEYAPLETAWVPVLGENYLYLYCLWVQGAPRGQGVGKALMESCLQDARAKGKAGVCMLGAEKQKAWLSDQRFAEKFGFQTVDTAGEYRLLAVRFDERPAPCFAPAYCLAQYNKLFVGTQPSFGQVPPSARFSTTAAVNPASAARSAHRYPPGPPPMTNTSNCSIMATSVCYSVYSIAQFSVFGYVFL